MQHKSEYFWVLVGRFLPLFIYLITTMILSRYLSPDDFGMIGVLSIFFMVANTLMDAGLGGSLVKEKKITTLDCSTIFVFNVVVSIILYLILFIFAKPIENYFGVGGLASVVRIICFIFIINAWGLVPRALLTRRLCFRTITIINVISVLGAAIVSITFAMFQLGVYSLVAYQLISATIMVTLSIIASRFPISFRFSQSSLRRLLPFGIYTTLTTIIDTIYENLMTFLFGKHLNIQQAGFLSQAKRLEEVPSQTVAQTISNAAFPILTKYRNEKERFAQECKNTFKNILLLTLPLLFTMSVFSESIILLVYGKQWQPAAPYLSLLAFAAIFHIAETLNRTFVKSTTQVNRLFNYTIIKRLLGITVIIACLLIDPRLVLLGYIISTVIGYFFNVVLLSKVSDITIKSQLRLFFVILLPNCAIYSIMYIVSKKIEPQLMQVIFSLVLLGIYYLYILRIYGINLLGYGVKQVKIVKKLISANLRSGR